MLNDRALWGTLFAMVVLIYTITSFIGWLLGIIDVDFIWVITPAVIFFAGVLIYSKYTNRI